MRVSYNWLRELLPTLKADPNEVALRLSAAGLAVDGVRRYGEALAEVIVAAVVAIEPHPKRANLKLVTVDKGGSQQKLVCGASNVPDPGGLVVLAGVGAKLPCFPEPLAGREIGGVLSEGMLCSTSELGLTEDSDGILILPPGSATPGQKLSEVLPSAVDTIYELDITPNRPDALGHVGVARELAALYDLPFALPEPKPPAKTSSEPLANFVSVENQDFERCPHYGAGVVTNVTVAPSPLALAFRLESLGVRSISNVVDVTNLLLLLYGQPLHAFDLEYVRGKKIIVRRARAGEPFTTLDGVARKLDADDLVICDAEGPSALAGVMGGQDSEIKDTTRTVLLECAYFTPRGVRRTARRHGMHTESSHRFERGVDFGNVAHVLEHAKSLLSELAGGTVVSGALHVKGTLPSLPTIPLRSQRLDALLGVAVPFAEAEAILGRLGFSVLEKSGEGAEARLVVRGASFRPDVSREEDLIEEVGRVRGLDLIPTVLPAIRPQAPRQTGKLEREIATQAVALGLSEALTYAFVNPRDLERLGAPAPVVKLTNPLSEERSVMRTSLLPGLVEALARARRRGETRVRLFSVGSLFLSPVEAERGGVRPRQKDDVGALPHEPSWFAAILAGPRPDYLALKSEDHDVFDAKAIATELVERVTNHRAEVRFVGADGNLPHLHPRGATLLVIGERVVGRFGPLHPDVIAAFDLGEGAVVIEIDLDVLSEVGTRVPRYEPIPRVPAVTRDLSLVVEERVLAGSVERLLLEAGGELCESIQVVADFRGGSVPAGHRSLTFRVVYRDPKAKSAPDSARTLTDQEVDQVVNKMLESAKKELGATLR
jgi:phenylalanyl-tRNA synthetase beta chain